jgi:hypothetical protein
VSKTERTTIVLGVIGGVSALALFALALVTQGSQGLLQVNRPTADYAALLVKRAPFLRADLGLDFIFIVVYCCLLCLAGARLEGLGSRQAVSGQCCDHRQFRDW